MSVPKSTSQPIFISVSQIVFLLTWNLNAVLNTLNYSFKRFSDIFLSNDTKSHCTSRSISCVVFE